MIVERETSTRAQLLEIALDQGPLPVSILSSLLREVQAALREVARGDDATRHAFSQQPQPVLHLSARITEGSLILQFTFADPFNSQPLPQLSAHAFDAFMDRFSQFLKGLPQPGLWRGPVGGVQRQRFPSEAARRLDQVRMELRRLPRARISFGLRTILIEGDRVEIG